MDPIAPNCEECQRVNTCGGCHLVIATLKSMEKVDAAIKNPDVLKALALFVQAHKN